MRTLSGLCREYSELYLKIRLGTATRSDKSTLCSVVNEIGRVEENMGVEFHMDASNNIKSMFKNGERVICEYSAPYDVGLEDMVGRLFTGEYSKGYTSYGSTIEAIPKSRVSSLFDLCVFLKNGEVEIQGTDGREVDYSEYEEVVPKSSLIRLFLGNRNGKIIMKLARVVNSRKCFLYSLEFV